MGDWLKARGVALIGSDAALDVMPSLVQGVNLPVHTLAITALGFNILDNQDLEAVGDLAASQKRWEFLLTVAPVPVIGRHRISGERDRHVLIASRSDVDGCSLTSWSNPHRLRA